MIEEVVMLRHGRTSYNLARRLQGQIDVPLDIVGQWQVDQSAFALAQRFYWAKVSAQALHPERIAQPGADAAEQVDVTQYQEAPAAARRMVVMSSDLFRAQQTAHAFADILGLDVVVDPRLRERSFGQWEGLTRAQIQAMDPEAYDSWKRHTGGETKYGVESRAEVGMRGSQALYDIIAELESGDQHDVPTTLMLVSHGSWITSTIAHLMDMDRDGLNVFSALRNAFWCKLSVRHSINGVPVECPLFDVDEYNRGPAIADDADWENGPADLRGPHMPAWKPVTW